MAHRLLAIALLGFMVGIATAVFVGGGTDEPAAVPVQVAASADADDAAGARIGSGVVHDHTGDVVSGVKALDIQAEFEPDKPLDRLTRSRLAMELAAAREVAMQYPTVADAEAAGMRLAGGFAPGSGAHYISFSGISGGGPIDVTKPNAYIYDGTSPDSQIVGLMYYSNVEPEGFAGPNDHWHRHSNVCVRFGGPKGLEVPFPADADISKKQCEKAGAAFLPVTGWMVHAWVVPGWESPQGVFSHENLNIRCADGTYETDEAGFCRGS